MADLNKDDHFVSVPIGLFGSLFCVILVCILIILHIFVYATPRAYATSDSLARQIVPASETHEEAVSIVEFSDFLCLYCKKAQPAIQRLIREFRGRVTLRFRHYPLAAHAFLSHEAALAAGKQGKFWEMHDAVFASQVAPRREDLIHYAGELGLDMDQFVTDLESGRYLQVIARDRAEGERLGVKGTPTFFINGRRLVGAQPYSVFKKVIEDELRRLKVEALGPVEDRSAGAAVSGPAEASATLAVFADFASPLSAKAAAMSHALRSIYSGHLRVLFKSFPLEFHQEAKLAHEAALAAGEQGKFWDMHDLLFQNQGRLGGEDLTLHAEHLGLDIATFQAALNSRRYQEVVRQDMLDGVNRDVRGVPTFFVNGRRLDGLPSLETLNAVIADELSKQISRKPEAASIGGLPAE